MIGYMNRVWALGSEGCSHHSLFVDNGPGLAEGLVLIWSQLTSLVSLDV